MDFIKVAKVVSTFLLLAVVLSACSTPKASARYTTDVPDEPISAEIPALPFSDNPDPILCGIPEPYGIEEPGLVTDEYEEVMS